MHFTLSSTTQMLVVIALPTDLVLGLGPSCELCRVEILLLLTSCTSLGRLFNLMGDPIPHVQIENNVYFIRLL